MKRSLNSVQDNTRKESPPSKRFKTSSQQSNEVIHASFFEYDQFNTVKHVCSRFYRLLASVDDEQCNLFWKRYIDRIRNEEHIFEILNLEHVEEHSRKEKYAEYFWYCLLRILKEEEQILHIFKKYYVNHPKDIQPYATIGLVPVFEKDDEESPHSTIPSCIGGVPDFPQKMKDRLKSFQDEYFLGQMNLSDIQHSFYHSPNLPQQHKENSEQSKDARIYFFGAESDDGHLLVDENPSNSPNDHFQPHDFYSPDVNYDKRRVIKRFVDGITLAIGAPDGNLSDKCEDEIWDTSFGRERCFMLGHVAEQQGESWIDPHGKECVFGHFVDPHDLDCTVYWTIDREDLRKGNFNNAECILSLT